MRRRMRLAVSLSGETLYMVNPITLQRESGEIVWYFRVCELNASSKSWCKVSSFKDAGVDHVLFITRDYYFFVAASEFPGCQLKNCIIFSEDAFPLYKRKHGWAYATKDANEVAIFSLDKNDEYSLPVELYPSFPVMLWSPPPWVIQNASSPCQLKWKSMSQSESEEHGMAQSDSDSKRGAPLHKDVSNVLSEPEEKTLEVLSTCETGADSTRSLAVINDIKHVTEEALETEKLEDAIGETDSVVCLVQPSIKEVVTLKKFQGLIVLPDHLPVLEMVWMKHGDVLEGSAICSCDTKTMALASLAKMVLILQTNDGNTLTSDQAQYLGSTLSDLQCMHLKVDWLAPFVEKALAIHKCKQLQISLMEIEKAKGRAEEMERQLEKATARAEEMERQLEKAKARAEEMERELEKGKARAEVMEREFLSEMAEMKQALDKDTLLFSQSMPVSGQSNQETCLGEGLF